MFNIAGQDVISLSFDTGVYRHAFQLVLTQFWYFVLAFNFEDFFLQLLHFSVRCCKLIVTCLPSNWFVVLSVPEEEQFICSKRW